MKLYLYVRAWATMLGYNIGQTMVIMTAARKENAPDNAVCKRQDGTWETIDTVQNMAAKVCCMKIHKQLVAKLEDM